MKKFYSEVTLLNQSFVLDPDKSVGKYILQLTIKMQTLKLRFLIL